MEETIINETDMSLEDIQMFDQQGSDYIDQGSEEWHADRLGNATASNFWKFANWTKGSKYVSPKPTAYWYSYRNELVAERLTGRYKRFGSKAMEWGINHEEDAALEYERLTGRIVGTLGFIKHPEYDAGASLDREVGEDGLVEIKCPNTDTAIDYVINGIPPNYYAQMQGQMWIAHKNWGDFVVFDPHLGNTYIQRIQRDDEYLNETLIPRLTQFLTEVDQVERKLRQEGYAAEQIN